MITILCCPFFHTVHLDTWLVVACLVPLRHIHRPSLVCSMLLLVDQSFLYSDVLLKILWVTFLWQPLGLAYDPRDTSTSSFYSTVDPPTPVLESVELLTSLAFLGDQPLCCRERGRERVRSCDIAFVMAQRAKRPAWEKYGFVGVIWGDLCLPSKSSV